MEVVALLTAMKEMGFEAGHIMSLIIMYFILRRDLLKVVSESIDKLTKAIKDLEQVHNERIQKIENHIGLNKTIAP